MELDKEHIHLVDDIKENMKSFSQS